MSINVKGPNLVSQKKQSNEVSNSGKSYLETLPSRTEELFIIGVLFLICSLPFLLGDQPRSLTSVAELGITSVQGDSSKQLILITIYALTGIALARRLNIKAGTAIGILFPTLLLWIFASATWSDLPGVAFRRAIALTGTLTLGVYMALRWKPTRLVTLLNTVAILVLSSSFLVALFFPSLGLDSESRLRGVFAHKNSLAVFGALSLLCAIAAIIVNKESPGRLMPRVAAILSIITLLAASSASPIPAVVVAIAILTYLVKRSANRSHSLTAGLCVLLFVAVLVTPWIASELGQVAILFGRNPDFSGRTSVWNFSLEFVQRRAFLGFGYSSFWNGSAGILFYRWAHFPVAHAHNGALQLLLDCGLVALLLLACIVSVMIFRMHSLLNSLYKAETLWVAAFIVLYLSSNLTETHLLEPNDLYTALFAYAIVYINCSYRDLKVSAEKYGAPAFLSNSK